MPVKSIFVILSTICTSKKQENDRLLIDRIHLHKKNFFLNGKIYGILMSCFSYLKKSRNTFESLEMLKKESRHVCNNSNVSTKKQRTLEKWINHYKICLKSV
jgi:hypothetical protein